MKSIKEGVNKEGQVIRDGKARLKKRRTRGKEVQKDRRQENCSTPRETKEDDM